MKACMYSQSGRPLVDAGSLMSESHIRIGRQGKRIKWLILPLHESETDRHLIGLSG